MPLSRTARRPGSEVLCASVGVMGRIGAQHLATPASPAAAAPGAVAAWPATSNMDLAAQRRRR